MITLLKTHPSFYRLLFVYIFVLLVVLVLSGCGQKGELYLPKDAHDDTSFILYDKNKSSTTHDNVNNKTNVESKALEQQTVIIDDDSLISDEHDY